ncbi:MAG TPA: hypothetical protein VLD37_06095 [Candidatus Bilamarchaeum sp.]|nr:hypothetical protein [Candidatus Bilamarchaeum sp.]
MQKFAGKFGRSVVAGAIVSLPLLEGCGAAVQEAKGPRPHRGDGEVIRYEAADGTLAQFALEKGEKALGSLTRQKYFFMISDRGFVSIDRSRPDGGDYAARAGLREVFSGGFLTWACSEESCFFLSSDRLLREVGADGKPRKSYDIGLDVSGAGMEFQWGKIFVAPAGGKMAVIDRGSLKVVDLPALPANSGLRASGNSLFIGVQGNELEILPDLGVR